MSDGTSVKGTMRKWALQALAVVATTMIFAAKAMEADAASTQIADASSQVTGPSAKTPLP
ncbi:MAG: hypothetical protein AAFY84_00450 [Pseudomonadota bacterium]